jgi:hypothetical protein
MGIEIWMTRADTPIEPRVIALVVDRAVVQSVVPSFHPVTRQLQVLAAIIVDAV